MTSNHEQQRPPAERLEPGVYRLPDGDLQVIFHIDERDFDYLPYHLFDMARIMQNGESLTRFSGRCIMELFEKFLSEEAINYIKPTN